MPLYITPQLQLSERYVNNSVHPVDRPSEEYISYLSASFHLNYEYSRGHLDSNLSLESTYSTQSFLATRLFANSFGDIGYVYSANRWSAEIKGNVVSSRFGETVSEFNEGILTPSTEYLQEAGSLHGSYLWTRQTTLSMNYAYSNNEYSSAIYVNSETHAVLFSVDYQFQSSDHLTFSSGADIFRYKPGATIQAGTANIQWTHRIRELALFRAGSGAGITSGENIYWLANLYYNQNFQEGSVEASLNRDFGSGGGLAGTSVINQQVNLTVSRTLLRELTGSISGNVGDSEAVIPGSNYHVQFWNSTLNFNYILSKSFSSSLAFSHYEQITTGGATGSLYSNQVFLTFSSSFTPWRPF